MAKSWSNSFIKVWGSVCMSLVLFSEELEHLFVEDLRPQREKEM